MPVGGSKQKLAGLRVRREVHI